MQLFDANFEYWQHFTTFDKIRDTDGAKEKTRTGHRPP